MAIWGSPRKVPPTNSAISPRVFIIGGKVEQRGTDAATEILRQKAEGRRQKAEGRRQKAEGRRQLATAKLADFRDFNLAAKG
jgi:hypothetical protein